MKVRSLLSDRPVARLPAGATVRDAVDLMTEAGCGSVLVLDDRGKLKGIFTERDLMVRVVSKGKDPRKVRLEEVMTTEVFTTDPDQRVTLLRREMRSLHIRHVPVVEDDVVRAVLSMRDLLWADFAEKREDAKAMTAYIRGEMLADVRRDQAQ